MQRLGLPIGLIHATQRCDRLVQHIAGGILQLLAGVRVRLDVALGRQQRTRHAGHLTQQTHARLDQRRGGRQHLALTVGQRIPRVGGHHAVAVQVRHGTAQEIVGIEHADVLGVDRNRLVQVEVGGIGLHVAHVELLDHLLHREHVTVRGDRPAEQRQVVEQALGDEAVLAVQEQVRLRVALGELLLALAHDVRHMAEHRHLLGHAQLHQVPVEHDLARGGAQQILAAQHHVHIHHRVVNRIGQRVQRIAVRAHDHVIRHRTGLELDAAADQIVEDDVLVGHADAQRGLAALRAERGLLLLGQVAVEPVIAELGRTAGGDVALLDLIRRRVRLVGIPGLKQAVGHLPVDGGTLGLAVRAVRAADLHALVPIQAEPTQRVEDLVVALLGIAGGVGVLDAEHEGAAGVAGFGPVEQGGADHTHMRGAGR